MSVTLVCVLPVLVFALVAVLLIVILPRVCPQGWEDDTAFHYGEKK